MLAKLLLLALLPWPARAADDAQARIARVESGLLPPVAIKGRPAPRYGLAERMKLYAVPGVSIAFIDKGSIAWTRAYGYADAAKKIPATPDTLFQAASLSKPVAAAAALRLVDRGLLTLDEDLNAALKSWKIPENGFTKSQKVTLRRLLSHSSGLGVHGFEGYASTVPVPSTIEVLEGKKPANSDPVRVEATPGSVTSYSGGGYTVLQLLLSEAAGKPFPRLMEEQVLQPAGMTSSAFAQPLPPEFLARAAAPHLAGGLPGEDGPHVYPELAAAGLWTTAADFARFAIAIQNSYAGRAGALLARATAREMLTDQREARGLGFALPPGTPKRFTHRGMNYGFTCVIQAFAEDGGQGVVIMTNTESPGSLSDEILRAVAAEYGWKDLLPVERVLGSYPASLSGLAGVYAADKYNSYAVSVSDRKLWLAAGGAPPVELLPATGGRYFTMTKAAVYRFADDETGPRLLIDDGTTAPKITAVR